MRDINSVLGQIKAYIFEVQEENRKLKKQIEGLKENRRNLEINNGKLHEQVKEQKGIIYELKQKNKELENEINLIVNY